MQSARASRRAAWMGFPKSVGAPSDRNFVALVPGPSSPLATSGKRPPNAQRAAGLSIACIWEFAERDRRRRCRPTPSLRNVSYRAPRFSATVSNGMIPSRPAALIQSRSPRPTAWLFVNCLAFRITPSPASSHNADHPLAAQIKMDVVDLDGLTVTRCRSSAWSSSLCSLSILMV
jgi:hypothetical protein